MVSLSLIFNQYVNPVALGKLGWKYYVSRIKLPFIFNLLTLITPQIVYVCWIAFELVYCYLFVLETKGLTLEETAALFDGKEAVEQIAHHRDRITDVAEDDKGTDSFSHGSAHEKA